MVAPITIASFQAVCIDCCSNIIAQALSCYTDGVPFHLDTTQFLRFALYAAITAPLNFLWQNFLERTFPKWRYERRKPDGRVEKIPLRDREGAQHSARFQHREKGSDLESSFDGSETAALSPEGGGDFVRKRNKRNIAFKWFTDCITMGALLNTTAFLVLMGAMKGKTLGEVGTSIREEEFTIIFNSYKIWPFASVVNFTFVPVEKRIVFLSFCGLLWNIYLSLVAGRI